MKLNTNNRIILLSITFIQFLPLLTYGMSRSTKDTLKSADHHRQAGYALKGKKPQLSGEHFAAAARAESDIAFGRTKDAKPLNSIKKAEIDGRIHALNRMNTAVINAHSQLAPGGGDPARVSREQDRLREDYHNFHRREIGEPYQKILEEHAAGLKKRAQESADHAQYRASDASRLQIEADYRTAKHEARQDTSSETKAQRARELANEAHTVARQAAAEAQLDDARAKRAVREAVPPVDRAFYVDNGDGLQVAIPGHH